MKNCESTFTPTCILFFSLLDSALEKAQLEIEELKENLTKLKENGESF